MSIVVKEINDQKIWSNFFKKNKPQTFLQTWQHGQVYLQLGFAVYYLGIYQNDSLVGIGLVIDTPARRGHFLFCPHGPLLDWNNPDYFLTFVDHLRKLAISKKASFIRIRPLVDFNSKIEKIFRQSRFKTAPIKSYFTDSLLLSLRPSSKQLLEQMRKNARSAIRLAIKKGATVTLSQTQKDFDDFFELYVKTAKRQHFVGHSKKFLSAEYNFFKSDNCAELLLVRHSNRVIAGAIILMAGGSAFYSHGASDRNNFGIPASQLILWRAINRAKNLGLQWFNFWGVISGERNHPWLGLSEFKRGFGGLENNYLPVQDLVINKRKYFFTWLIETCRMIRRGL